jgi:hypothetical protein
VTCLALYLHPEPVLRRGLVDGSVGQVVLKRRTCEKCGGDGYFDQVDSRTTPQRVADLTCSNCEGRGWLPALVPESATPTEVREPGRLGIVEKLCRLNPLPGGPGPWLDACPHGMGEAFIHETCQVVSVVRPVTERLEVVDHIIRSTKLPVVRLSETNEAWLCSVDGPPTTFDVAADLQPGDVVLTLGAPEPLAEPITEMVCSECGGNGGGWPDHPTMCGGHPCPVCEGVCETCLGEPIPLAVEAGSVEEVETP